MIPIWMAATIALLSCVGGVAIGVAIMAACAMAGSDGDEQRSEPE